MSKLHFFRGPFDGLVLEGVNVSAWTGMARIVLETESVAHPANLGLLPEGFHLKEGDTLRHIYEFNDDSDDPRIEWTRYEVSHGENS